MAREESDQSDDDLIVLDNYDRQENSPAAPAVSTPTEVATDEETAGKARLDQLAAEIHELDVQVSQLTRRRALLEAEHRELRAQLTERRAARLLVAGDWENRRFSWTERLDATLRERFGIGGYRPQQRAAINAALSGHDVLLVMPTGGGKSLCYQLPAVADQRAGVTLVISPLVSLMEDQVMALQARGMSAAMLTANTTRQEAKQILDAMTDKESQLRLLYVTPEKMAKSKRFMTKLQAMHRLKRLRLLAIDEVHCCSQWGHDFRPDYKFLGVLKGMFADVPVMGLTATCTGEVARDVKKMLHIPDAMVFKAPFNRPNLFYSAEPKPPTLAGCVDRLTSLLTTRYRGQSGIIYTTATRDTEELAAKLHAAGVKAGPYHAQMPPKTRSTVHSNWTKGKLQVVVATIAFGMGIDKPDVRFVIHHSLSKSLIGYYQESGRAGRDGQPADCLLLFRLQDVFTLSAMVFTDAACGLDNLYSMLNYCVTGGECRRALIARHFEATWTADDCARQCDVCRRDVGTQQLDVTRHARALSELLKRAAAGGHRVTAAKLMEAWMGKGSVALRVPNQSPPNISQSRAEAIVAHLVVNGYLREDFHFTPYRTISYVLAGPNDGVYPVHMEVADPAAAPSRRSNGESKESQHTTDKRRTEHRTSQPHSSSPSQKAGHTPPKGKIRHKKSSDVKPKGKSSSGCIVVKTPPNIDAPQKVKEVRRTSKAVAETGKRKRAGSEERAKSVKHRNIENGELEKSSTDNTINHIRTGDGYPDAVNIINEPDVDEASQNANNLDSDCEFIE